MRNVLASNNLPCPKYQLVQDASASLNQISFDFPVIVKPVDRSGSKGVYKVDDMDSLRVAVENSNEVSFCKKVIIEEYIEGTEYSVEFISQNHRHHFLQITEKFTTGDPNFIEKGHLSPARIPSEKKKEALKVVEDALNALKIESGPSHSEVKITPNGDIIIIEIAGRMGGDFIGSDMVYISTGVDFLKNTIDIAVGKKIDFTNNYHGNYAFVGFIFTEEDKERLAQVKKLFPEVIQEYYTKDYFQAVHDSTSRNGYYILNVEDRENMEIILDILNMEGKVNLRGW